MPTATLTNEEIAMLGRCSRLIVYAKELVRKADQAQRNFDSRQSQRLLVAQNG